MDDRSPRVEVGRTVDGKYWTWTRTEVGEWRENGGSFPTLGAALLDAYRYNTEDSNSFLDCPMCGARSVFSINPTDESKGYCAAENIVWSVSPPAL
jgi:hypothetical protein